VELHYPKGSVVPTKYTYDYSYIGRNGSIHAEHFDVSYTIEVAENFDADGVFLPMVLRITVTDLNARSEMIYTDKAGDLQWDQSETGARNLESSSKHKRFLQWLKEPKEVMVWWDKSVDIKEAFSVEQLEKIFGNTNSYYDRMGFHDAYNLLSSLQIHLTSAIKSTYALAERNIVLGDEDSAPEVDVDIVEVDEGRLEELPYGVDSLEVFAQVFKVTSSDVTARLYFQEGYVPDSMKLMGRLHWDPTNALKVDHKMTYTLGNNQHGVIKTIRQIKAQ